MNPFRSWLGAVNFLVLQWLFIRLVETVQKQPAGTHLGVQYYRDVHEKWSLMLGVVPLTGWWSRYWRLPLKELDLGR